MLRATNDRKLSYRAMALRWSAARDDDGRFAILLENNHLRVTILPELGGKIWSIVFLPRGREMLWHHPRLTPRPVAPGAPYDDVFCGGWDEIFPSDSPVSIDSFDLPDHGEWWSIPWAWRVDEDHNALTLSLAASGFATPHEATRIITLRDNAATIELATRVRNTGARAIPFLWRHHPALPLAPGARVDLPPARILVDPALTPGIADAPFTWPHARDPSGDPITLGILPAADSGQTWMLYATDLPAGWCAVTYPEDNLVFRLTFDHQQIDTVTFFATFGGWRGLATILPEPGVGYPSDLQEARQADRHGTLASGEMVEFAVQAEILAL
jgi:hypothetical protein